MYFIARAEHDALVMKFGRKAPSLNDVWCKYVKQHVSTGWLPATSGEAKKPQSSSALGTRCSRAGKSLPT